VLVALVFAGVAMAGVGLMVTQYLQSVLGYSPLASGLLFAPMGLGVAAGTMTAPALARRVRTTTAIGAGLALSVVGAASLTLAGATAVSAHLPTGQAAALLLTARAAFTSGLHVTGVVAAVIFTGSAVLVIAPHRTAAPAERDHGHPSSRAAWRRGPDSREPAPARGARTPAPVVLPPTRAGQL
jgi:hypothetical protein